MPRYVRLPPDFAAEAAPTIDAQFSPVGGASAPRAAGLMWCQYLCTVFY